MRNRAFWIDNILIRASTFIGLCTSQKQFDNTLKALEQQPRAWIKTAHSDATTHFTQDQKGRNITIVCIRTSDSVEPIQLAAMLVHEAVHIFQWYCAHIGEQYPSDEFEAYSIQSISQELMYTYVDLTKKGTKK
jgi:hypothetical protein